MADSRAPAVSVLCRSCGRELSEANKYCPQCGAPRETSGAINDNFACIYGPPPPMPGPSGRRHLLPRLLSKLFHR